LLCGTLGRLLQFWLLSAGTEEKGLYPVRHPGWIFSWVLAVAVFVFVWLLTRQVGNNRNYTDNFPASTVGACGCIAAALATATTAISHLLAGTMWLDAITGLLGFAGSVGLLIAAGSRIRGKKPSFLCYMLPCVFFALHVFYLGRELGGEPEAVRYLFPFLATLSLIPACYQLWGFCVGSGERKSCLFWSLTSGFLCILSAPISGHGLMYLALGFWLLSNPCALKYLPRRNKPAPQSEPAPEAESEQQLVAPEIPCTMEEDLFFVSEPSIEEIVADADPEQEQEWDVDAIIAEILQEIDSNVP
jgi:hypothetical protein